MNKKSILLKILVIALIVSAVWICFKFGLCHKYNAAGIKNYIASFGMLGPIIYIIMFTLVPLTLFPNAVLALASGMAFGVVYGMIYTIIGAVLGAALSFYIARFLGKDMVEKLVRGRGKWFGDGVEKKGFLIVFALRLIPLVPFDIISYGAGLSKIKFKDFLLATAIGIIPGVFVFINLGDKSQNAGSLNFIFALVLLGILVLVSYFIKNKISFDKLQDDLSGKEVDNTK
ncbi:TVP38/TMEM64 family protein [Clostridium sp. JNZ X4-2]